MREGHRRTEIRREGKRQREGDRGTEVELRRRERKGDGEKDSEE